MFSFKVFLILSAMLLIATAAPQIQQGQQLFQGVGRVFAAGLETAAEAFLQRRGVPIGPHQHSGLFGDSYSPGSGGFNQGFGQNFGQGFNRPGFNGGF